MPLIPHSLGWTGPEFMMASVLPRLSPEARLLPRKMLRTRGFPEFAPPRFESPLRSSQLTAPSSQAPLPQRHQPLLRFQAGALRKAAPRESSHWAIPLVVKPPSQPRVPWAITPRHLIKQSP
jgi:hypothetical protein